MKTWTLRVKSVYSSLQELRDYNKIYNIAKRCGYTSCKKLWEDNPLIGGSGNPSDFGVVNNIFENDHKANKKRLTKSGNIV